MSREWMLANGLGGYAMGTISGINTRRYHGHLIAATKPPSGRKLLLATIEASLTDGEHPLWLSANQYPGAIFPRGYELIESFRATTESVTWIYRSGTERIEKTLAVHPGSNAVTAIYRNLGPEVVRLSLRPLVAVRDHHGNFLESSGFPSSIAFPGEHTILDHDQTSIVIKHLGASRIPVQGWYYRFEHEREIERGLDPRDDLYCPCELQYLLGTGEAAILVVSEGLAAEAYVPAVPTAPESQLDAILKEACGRFLVSTPQRTSIIAGYPWFTDWGRDTMISLPGICLCTGRSTEAKEILQSYAGSMKDGLIPNRFVEDGETAEYNTVDATLWFVNAVYKTLELEWDEAFARKIFGSLEQVYASHIKGTHHGIGVDGDGLLKQGEPGLQLTWMDAKVGDWVVTPRHGKPIEVNALWINALRVMEWMAQKLGKPPVKYRKSAEKAEASFEAKFWCESRGHYFDTVDPNDASLRPNQLIAMALPFAPAKGDRALKALRCCEQELVTPFGLRTLGPAEPGYRGECKGSLPELDAAYHQGTVWPWLLGPYLTAMVKLTGDVKTARAILKDCRPMLLEYGIGGIAEVYSGNEPHHPGGCPWQAWSVAELLRVLVEDCS